MIGYTTKFLFVIRSESGRSLETRVLSDWPAGEEVALTGLLRRSTAAAAVQRRQAGSISLSLSLSVSLCLSLLCLSLPLFFHHFLSVFPIRSLITHTYSHTHTLSHTLTHTLALSLCSSRLADTQRLVGGEQAFISLSFSLSYSLFLYPFPSLPLSLSVSLFPFLPQRAASPVSSVLLQGLPHPVSISRFCRRRGNCCRSKRILPHTDNRRMRGHTRSCTHTRKPTPTGSHLCWKACLPRVSL
ncbi:hypothetical protein AALO_G00012670 [Alosa alosa]|uniref:Uncharacterized protein n=1 Tax=Alosa alosa TaxID=278164 RepID=A0AAV6HFX9_9TELE|nr:hypothetical protein AALO_G00012670 [Alosa alosa]